MNESFVELSDFEAALEWELSEGEQRAATYALDALSTEAASHGKSTWTATTVPAIVKTKITNAAIRYLRNLEGVIQSRAGDETLGFPEYEKMGSPTFTPDEIKDIIAAAMGRNSFGTIPILAYGKRRQPTPTELGFVNVVGGGEMFPLYSPDDWLNPPGGAL